MHAVDPIHAVDEEDEDEDENDLHPVLELRHDGILRDEPAPRQHVSNLTHDSHSHVLLLLLELRACPSGDREGRDNVREHLALDGEGEGYDEQAEDAHLDHQDDEHLPPSARALDLAVQSKGRGTYQSVVERHLGDGLPSQFRMESS